MFPDDITQYEIARVRLSQWRKRIIALLWIVYAGFYLCRVNLPAAQKDLAAAEGLSKRQLGLLLSLLKLSYASGQFLNGMLADRLGPRALIVMGLSASAGLNLVFAHLQSYRGMAIVWLINGYFQACGWTPVVRTIANWFPVRLRDAASGIIGTAYILGSGVSWLIAGNLTERYGWRYAFWVPSWICLVIVVVFWTLVKNRPQDAGLGEVAAEDDDTAPPVAVQARPLSSLANPKLWALGFSMLAFNFGYHGMLDWLPHYLADAGRVGSGVAATRAVVMPVGGGLGCLLLTIYARKRGTQMQPAAIVMMLVALAGLTYSFPQLVERMPQATPLWLALLGALSSVPASVMACSMAANIVAFEGAGTAAGIVDAMGYVGSAVSGWASGRIMDGVGKTRGQAAAWRAVWHVWPFGILAAAALVGAFVRYGKKPPATCAPPRIHPPEDD